MYQGSALGNQNLSAWWNNSSFLGRFFGRKATPSAVTGTPTDFAEKTFLRGQSTETIAPWKSNSSIIGRFLGHSSPAAPASVTDMAIPGVSWAGLTSGTRASAGFSSSSAETIAAVTGSSTASVGTSASVRAAESAIGGINYASRFGRAAGWGAGIGLGLSAGAWIGSKIIPGAVDQKRGMVGSALSGAVMGTVAAGAYTGLQKLAQAEGSWVKPWMNTAGRIGGGRYGMIGLGLTAGIMGAKSIVSTSLTRSTN